MSDREITIARWTESPYTSYGKRSITIDHRVRIVGYGRFLDVLHERRENDDTTGEWKEVEVVEWREGMMRHREVRDGVLRE